MMLGTRRKCVRKGHLWIDLEREGFQACRRLGCADMRPHPDLSDVDRAYVLNMLRMFR